MKNVINYALSLILLTTILITFNSCGKVATKEAQIESFESYESFEEAYAQATSMYPSAIFEDEVGSLKKVTITDTPPGKDCPYESCSTAMPAVLAIIQNIANQQCRIVLNGIPCCDDNDVWWVLMIAYPQSPPCAATE